MRILPLCFAHRTRGNFLAMTAPRDPFFPAERSIRASDKPLEVRFLGRMDYQLSLIHI